MTTHRFTLERVDSTTSLRFDEGTTPLEAAPATGSQAGAS